MTIKSLIGHDITKLEQMSDAELRTYLAPYLVEYILDLEEVEVEGEGKKVKKGKSKKDVSNMELAAILASNGITMPMFPAGKK